MWKQLTWKQYFSIFLGTTLMAMAVNLIYEPMGLVTGGVSGAAILIKKLTGMLDGNIPFFKDGIPVGITNLLLNIPIFIAAWKCKGKEFILRTLLANTWFTFMLLVIPECTLVEKDYLLAALVGGVLTGAGLGLVFMTGTSTGGTDLLAVVINRRLSYMSVARILFVVDSLIVFAGALMFGVYSAIYAVLAVFVASKVMDAIAEGLKFAKLVYVISDAYEEISQDVMDVLGRGNTVIDAKGMYRGEERKMLLCVMGRKEIGVFMSIVSRHDKNAFMIVTDAKEVLGEGFIEFE